MRSFQPGPSDHEAAARLVRDLGIHPVTAQVLTRRGVQDPDAARRFLKPTAEQLHDPGLFRDMDRAVSTLEEAVRAGRKVAVYGDYDVDGVSGTTVLLRTLSFLGAEGVRAFIPDRLAEGYGLNAEALFRLRDEGCDIVVTVDNGTSRAEEIAAAKERGLEMVVTDHHEQGVALPDCPVVNPKRRDSSYPFPGLAGCGVAFKVALALTERFGLLGSDAFKKLLPDLMAVVAIGTVADVVPLLDENRSLVALGLKALTATQHPGLRALLEVSRCTRRPVTPLDVAFKLGPRINAAGRLGSAHTALDLFMCEDPARAASLAAELDTGNRERQRIERDQADQAYARAEGFLEENGRAPALVMGDPTWHPGVIGIVAARVSEQFGRPAALIAVEGERARGSARSFGQVRLHEALERCSGLLETHGGHASAAGFTLMSNRIDAFREAFLAAVAAQGEGETAPREVDAELPLDALSPPLATELEMLQPFGTGNPEPLFCAFGVGAAGRPRRLGSEGRHLSFFAATERTSVRAIAFNQADRDELVNGRFDLAFQLRRRDGPEEMEIVVREIAPCSSTAP